MLWKPPLLYLLLFGLGVLRGTVAVSLKQVPQQDGRHPPVSRAEERPVQAALGPCNVCKLNSDSAPRMFMLGKLDGLGATAHSLICGMAVAAKWGMRFGGMLQTGHSSHGVPVAKTVHDFLDVNWSHRVFWKRSELNGFKLFNRLVDIGKYNRGTGATNVLYNTTTPQYQIGPANYSTYLSPKFLGALRAQAMPGMQARAGSFRPGAPSVALHVRRGDVTADDKSRYTPDQWYLSVVAEIRKILPNADVHAWSSTEGSQETLADFKNFTQSGITVHLDGDPLDAWGHFSVANVFVMAKSTFSKVPALLNNGCVIFQDDARGYRLPEWMDGTKPSRAGYAEDLAECVRRGAA